MNFKKVTVSLVAQAALLIGASAFAQTPTGPIPSDFFGMHLINYLDWPTVPFGTLGKGTGVTWPAVERTKGVYDWSRVDAFVNEASPHSVSFAYSSGGVPPWAAADQSTCNHNSAWGTWCSGTVANMQDWDNFVTQLVSRYKGRIQIYELWNEPQNSFTGTMAQFVALTQHEHDIIRSIDPAAIIVSPSAVSYGSAYLDSYFAAGGSKDVDALSFHPYPPPNNDIAEVITGSLTTSIRAVMAKYGLAAKPLWDTESSWGYASSGAITDPDLRAAFIARSYLLHWSMGIRRIDWYAWDNSNIGTLWGSATGISEAGIAYEQVYSWMNGATMPQPCSYYGTNGYHAIYTCDLTRSGGYQARAVWNTDGNSTYTVPTQFTQYRDLRGNIYGIPSNRQVTIGHQPILLQGTATASTPVNNSALTLTSLTPASTKAGGAGFTLIINGSGFISGAVVSWNGSGRYRTFVSSTQMTAAISAKDIATAGVVKVTVTNPAPGENSVYAGCKCSVSNALSFTINP